MSTATLGAIYRAEIDTASVGITGDLGVVSGIRLRLIYQDGYDCLADELQNLGVDAVINLPDGGLTPGQLYTPCVTNEARDWETGCIDSWDITIYPFTGEIPE